MDRQTDRHPRAIRQSGNLKIYVTKPIFGGKANVCIYMTGILNFFKRQNICVSAILLILAITKFMLRIERLLTHVVFLKFVQ